MLVHFSSACGEIESRNLAPQILSLRFRSYRHQQQRCSWSPKPPLPSPSCSSLLWLHSPFSSSSLLFPSFWLTAPSLYLHTTPETQNLCALQPRFSTWSSALQRARIYGHIEKSTSSSGGSLRKREAASSSTAFHRMTRTPQMGVIPRFPHCVLLLTPLATGTLTTEVHDKRSVLHV